MKTLLIALCTLLALTANANAAEQKASQGYAIATFAGGCFWCMEPPFDKLDGVISTTSGYMGGHVDNPTYQQVSKGGTGHAEVMQVTYDPDRISYKKLLQTFWKNVDPTDAGGQFCDRGNQYRTGIFYHSEAQRQLAQQSKTALVADKPFSDEIVTPIVQASSFYPAEEYHQDYYQKNPIRYKYYRFSCGRDARLERLWGD
jgi:peptide-methionine (S)-S-oxide reductase